MSFKKLTIAAAIVAMTSLGAVAPVFAQAPAAPAAAPADEAAPPAAPADQAAAPAAAPADQAAAPAAPAGDAAAKVNAADQSTPYGLQHMWENGGWISRTILGVLVNEYATTAADREVQVVATMYGRLNFEVDDHEGGSLLGTEYEIKSISSYLLTIGTQEIARFNIELGGWVDSDGQSTRLANMLGLTV